MSPRLRRCAHSTLVPTTTRLTKANTTVMRLTTAKSTTIRIMKASTTETTMRARIATSKSRGAISSESTEATIKMELFPILMYIVVLSQNTDSRTSGELSVPLLSLSTHPMMLLSTITITDPITIVPRSESNPPTITSDLTTMTKTLRRRTTSTCKRTWRIRRHRGKRRNRHRQKSQQHQRRHLLHPRRLLPSRLLKSQHQPLPPLSQQISLLSCPLLILPRQLLSLRKTSLLQRPLAMTSQRCLRKPRPSPRKQRLSSLRHRKMALCSSSWSTVPSLASPTSTSLSSN